MKKFRKVRKTVLVVFNIIFMSFILSPVLYGANAATREENVKKIGAFLQNEQIRTFLREKGASAEDVAGKLGSMSDTQVEKLAEHATMQVGGEIKDSGEDFWTFYKWYLIASLVLFVVVIGTV